MNKNNELIFKVNDTVFLRHAFFKLVVGTIGYIVIDSYEYQHIMQGIGRMFCIWIIARGLFGLFFYLKNKDYFVEFYADKIAYSSRKNNILKHEDIYKVYNVSFLSLWDWYESIYKYNLFRRIFYLIAFFMIIWPCYLVTYIFMCLYFKRIIHNRALVVTQKNTRKAILIQLPEENSIEEKKIKEYFEKYFSLNILDLDKKIFIPNEG